VVAELACAIEDLTRRGRGVTIGRDDRAAQGELDVELGLMTAIRNRQGPEQIQGLCKSRARLGHCRTALRQQARLVPIIYGLLGEPSRRAVSRNQLGLARGGALKSLL